MPTKAPPRSERKGPRVVQRSMYADDAFWVALAAKHLGTSMHELISRRVRKYARKVLAESGNDPDALWARRNGE